ncbi:MAG: hypothetical protein M3517_03700 [Actinomycetota bacterium]|nr:hypothetical protein [Actinomycetota bacterium]
MPVAPEIGGDLGNRAAVATDLQRRPLRCPATSRGDEFRSVSDALAAAAT